MIVEELWSDRHQAQARACARMALVGDLCGALSALEGASPETAVGDRAELDRWGRELRRRSPRPERAREQAEALQRFLGEELDFHGDADDYYAARNSHLHEVLTRRRGLPILLSAIWLHVGSRAGFAVAGVGLPGHFVVRVGDRDSGALVDPFTGGRLLSLDDCKRLVREASAGTVEWRDDHLEETPVDRIVERVLSNLAGAAVRRGDAGSLFRAFGFLVALRPDDASYAVRRGDVAANLGAETVAAEIYEDVVRRFPGSPQARAAHDRRRKLAKLLN